MITIAALPAVAEEPAPTDPPTRRFSLVGAKASVTERADAVLSMMAFSVVPDLASGVINVSGAEDDRAAIILGQTGGGFTLGSGFSPYVEGCFGYSRYDPKFIASDGAEQRRIPAKWNTFAGSGGIGWDFPLIRDLTLRPIFNFSLGHVESDSSAAGRLIEHVTDAKLKFLQKGRLNAYGLGGSLALDYWRFRERYDFELLVRYTNIYLQTFDTPSGVNGSADAATVSLYSRLRAPTGLILLRRPFRYVLELSNSTYVGDQRGLLGFNYLSSAGAGFELDISAYHTVLSRLRWVVRYYFGDGASGFSAGVSVS